MARQERPVDPAAGPLQAFAYDLRMLRAEAGNPTYRVLARTAGYSATTLSEAAGGARMPSLEVVLAYVGACHGDLDDWRQRWYRTTAELGSTGEAGLGLTGEAGLSSGGAPGLGSGGVAGLSSTGVAGLSLGGEAGLSSGGVAAPTGDPGPAGESGPADGPTVAAGWATSPVVAGPGSGTHVGAATPGTPVEPGRHGTPAPEPNGERSSPSGTGPTEGRPRRRRTVAVGVAVAATLLVAVVAAKTVSSDPPVEDTAFETPAGAGQSAGGVPGCPEVPGDALFTGTTYGSGAHVRDGATRDNTILHTVPPDCTVGFTGYCIGEKIYDNTAGTPDVRWFTVAGGGVVASGIIHGNPPRDLPAAECPGGRPAPSGLTFATTAQQARRAGVDLHATGTELDVVGFAVSTGADPATPGARTWRQLALVEVRDRAVGARHRLDTVPAPVGGAPVVLVAAACLGGDSPTGLVEARQFSAETPGRSTAVTLDPPQQVAAGASACRYPGRG
ncbi:hypothetical protein GCM10022225_78940 [Plantactinospora mayteni]|uniref:HTH cro/C1-type domain-containing protein n=1 Tax=Plantactinospora mayteni TaxID=566021 RepID=A0ABQ4F2W1_9ACTN|nr:hypothetical protein [Plantactinospora mayteni]GIH01256.1 hypothetical protein Pma05_78280 [Plantactinospora mayteni]